MIISFILVTFMLDSRVTLKGEIRCIDKLFVLCLFHLGESYSCEFGSATYYAYCGFGGILSCGITHTAVVPLDLVKCRIQVTFQALVNPLIPKIRLLILPSSCYTFFFKLVIRIWR